jgi:hypothetical protein
MEEKGSPGILVWLALRAALYGVGLITVYSTLASVMLRLGLAPK